MSGESFADFSRVPPGPEFGFSANVDALSDFNLLLLGSEELALQEMMTLAVSSAGTFTDSHSDELSVQPRSRGGPRFCHGAPPLGAAGRCYPDPLVRSCGLLVRSWV